MEIDRIQLKKYFETGKRPTQSNFADLIDSLALVSELPPREEAPYSGVSLLLSCDSVGPGKPRITYTLLDNNLPRLLFYVQDNRISIMSADTRYEFNVEKLFINIGALNDTCSFDKVVFSLSESTSSELVLYCETIKAGIRMPETPEGPIFTDPGLGDAAISFQHLPIEIRVYNEIKEEALPVFSDPEMINP